MRVIAGQFRGMPLRAPAGDATRPTSDRVREALFSMLGSLDPPAVEGARVLDLFAGSGALGIEALSRGASSVTFVEVAVPAIAAIQANLAKLRPVAGPAGPATQGKTEVVRRGALAHLDAAFSAAHQYDLVFLDPPYKMASELADPLATRLPAVLARGARVVAESDRRAPLALELALVRERRYGDTLITIYDAE